MRKAVAKCNGHSQTISNGMSRETMNEISNGTFDKPPTGVTNGTSKCHPSDSVNGNLNANGTSNSLCNGTSNGISNGHTGNPVNRNTGTNGTAKPWPCLLPVSASTTKSLQMRVEDLRQYIESRPGSLKDVAHTLGVRRVHLPHRTFCIAEDGGDGPLEFSAVPKACASTVDNAKVAYVFTGQGAQWVGMGKSLIHGSPSFREGIREMDRTLQQLDEPPQWTIEGLIFSRLSSCTEA